MYKYEKNYEIAQKLINILYYLIFKVKGKIVVFAQKWAGYGATVAYRGKGASVASKRGAIATLIRYIQIIGQS